MFHQIDKICMKKILKKIIVTIITWQAQCILKRYKPKIIAVTGSVGKTSTKDAIFTILSKFKTVRKSEKSFNSEIGLPLTILGVPNGWNNFFIWFENIIIGFYLIIWKQSYPEYLVLEIGVGKPGDIKKNVLPWLKTDIVVITHFPDRPVHVEFFGSVDKIIEEKSALIYTLKKDGILVLNHDDEKVYSLHYKSKNKTVSYGMAENATYHCIHPNYLYKKRNDVNIPNGINFKLEYEGNVFPVNLPNFISMDHIGHTLAALACSCEIGCDLLTSIKTLEDYKTPPGRLSLIEGINNSIILDDTYNSSPIAMEAALKVLKDISAKRKIAVLGDMLELGKFTEEEHKNIGSVINSIADILVTVGPRAKFIAESALDHDFPQKNVYIFDSHLTASKFLEGIVESGDVILIKGSQGVRLEKVVESIMINKENKTSLLCRQDREWRAR